MRLGARVVVEGQDGVGHLEAIDEPFADVRWLTPKNEPSCVVSGVWLRDVIEVGENVIPRPRSAEWYAESEAFCQAIADALEDV